MPIPALIGAGAALLGSAMSGLFNRSSAKQQQAASLYAMQQEAEINKEMYQQRYQWTAKDMIKAGLNPILAAGGGFSVGSGPSVGLPTMASAAPMQVPDIASSARSMAEADKVEEEKREVIARTVKAGNEAIESIERARTNRAQQNLLTTQEARTAEEVIRTIQEVKQISSRIGLMDWQAAREESTIETQGVERSAMGASMELMDAHIRQLSQATKNLRLLMPELERTSDVYSGRAGTVIKYAEEILHAIGPGVTGGLVGGMFGSYMRSGRRGKQYDWSKDNFMR